MIKRYDTHRVSKLKWRKFIKTSLRLLEIVTWNITKDISWTFWVVLGWCISLLLHCDSELTHSWFYSFCLWPFHARESEGESLRSQNYSPFKFEQECWSALEVDWQSLAYCPFSKNSTFAFWGPWKWENSFKTWYRV